MKRILTFAIILVSMISMFGCNQKIDINDQFSEITRVYYNGQSMDGQMSASISVGEREEYYIIDGKHTENCDFSLIVIRFHFLIEETEINIDFFTNYEKTNVTLEYNPLNSTYIADLGYAIDDGKEYSIKYQENSLHFVKASSSFKVDYKSAIETSLIELGDKIDSYYNGNVFNGECYLKILSKPDGDFQDLYWIFTVVGKNKKSNNVVIDIKDGSIILSN